MILIKCNVSGNLNIPGILVVIFPNLGILCNSNEDVFFGL